MIELNHEQLSRDIDTLCEELVNLFEAGSSVTAVEFVKKYLDFQDIITKDLPEEIEFLNDKEIPYNININNKQPL